MAVVRGRSTPPRRTTRKCAAPLARRARQRLAPTGVCRASLVGHSCATGRRNPRPVGVRRCLTRWSVRAGQWPGHGDGRGARTVNAAAAGAPVCAAPPARPGDAARRPYRGMPCIPGRAFVRNGRVRPPSGRGQAVPDPPARRAGQSSRWRSISRGAVRRGGGAACRVVRVAAPCGAAGRGSASPLPGSAA